MNSTLRRASPPAPPRRPIWVPVVSTWCAGACAACRAYSDASGRRACNRRALTRRSLKPTSISPSLADRLERIGERRISICLQGPPGTGKSAYARYLADRLGLEVMHRRASDLMSMWVGGTEQNIARAFAEARDTEAFLIFDEADSLLSDRRGAHRSWEVAQINEMLTWMESHPLPFVCTTNDGERLDSAVAAALCVQGKASAS